MSKQEYEKYISIVEAISKEMEVRKMREEFLQCGMNCKDYAKTRKKKTNILKNL